MLLFKDLTNISYSCNVWILKIHIYYLVLDKIWNSASSGTMCAVIKDTYKIFDNHLRDVRDSEITDEVIDAYLHIISQEINVSILIISYYLI